MVNNVLDRPSILVYVEKQQESLLKEILAGIEEEGIPYDLIKKPIEKKGFIEKVYLLTHKSRMGIAVGITESRVVLHYNKLKEDKPLLDIKLNFYEKEKARIIGSNAARLYKTMPFKNIDNFKSEEQLIEEIRAAVMNVLKTKNIKIQTNFMS